MPSPKRTVFTVGHSTHPLERFQALLVRNRIAALADVRRYPASRRHPQFGAAALESALAGAGIEYVKLGEQLGGRRKGGFQGYFEHIESADFAEGLDRLERLATQRATAVMCAEGDWRRCHRRLIADALLARGWRVCHVLPDGSLEEHPPSLASQ